MLADVDCVIGIVVVVVVVHVFTVFQNAWMSIKVEQVL